MKIQYCSDLHLEFKDNERYLRENPIEPEGEILLLAGDIMPFSHIKDHSSFFDYVSKYFKFVYWIPGNHEYYHSDVEQYISPLRQAIRKNVFLVNNQTLQYKGVNLIFSTLWSKISHQNEWTIERSVTDFYCIKFHGKKFTPMYFNQMHQTDLNYITNSLEAIKEGNTIVVSHHVPTLIHYPEPFLHSNINEAFAVDLTTFIDTSGVDYWIYGHHHTNNPPFKIGKTEMLTNQLGYVRHNEHRFYQKSTCIEI